MPNLKPLRNNENNRSLIRICKFNQTLQTNGKTKKETHQKTQHKTRTSKKMKRTTLYEYALFLSSKNYQVLLFIFFRFIFFIA